MSNITLNLPDTFIQNANNAAQVLHCSTEELLSSMLQELLPNLENIPEYIQSELLRMVWLNDQALQKISQEILSEQEQNQLHSLSLRGEYLNLVEQQRLNHLRQRYGEITLRKARAYALLSTRSGKALLDKKNDFTV